MHDLETVKVQCPACGEMIELVVDCSLAFQRYVEDCEVCCRPLHILVSVEDGGFPSVRALSEDDARLG